MVCGLAGNQVRAGFAVWGCGFYDLTAQLNGPKSTLGKMPEDERALDGRGDEARLFHGIGREFGPLR